MQTLHHKRNEKKEIEFFQDKECTIPFDFTNAEDLYVQGDIATLMDLFATYEVDCETNIYIPYLTTTWNELCLQDLFSSPVKTLDDITPNLSKYIPEDNAVLFLSKEDRNQYDYNDNLKFCIVCQDSIIPDSWKLLADKSSEITIFLPHGTQSELQKAEEVVKELKEKYGVEEVNLFALHWFGSEYQENDFEIEYLCKDFGVLSNFNKIITTNSTGILKPEDSNERLQVIDCKEIFDGYLKNN